MDGEVGEQVGEDKMNDKRQISKDLVHAIQHIENGDTELALNILKVAVGRERGARRNTHKPLEGIITDKLEQTRDCKMKQAWWPEGWTCVNIGVFAKELAELIGGDTDGVRQSVA